MSSDAQQPLPPGMPNSLKKRRLLNDKGLSPQMCRELGEKFLAIEWWEDALAFFQKGDCQEGLEKLKAVALENGDAFLLARINKDRDPELWRGVAGTAHAQGKLAFARRAWEMAGDEENAKEVSLLMAGEKTLPQT